MDENDEMASDYSDGDIIEPRVRFNGCPALPVYLESDAESPGGGHGQVARDEDGDDDNKSLEVSPASPSSSSTPPLRMKVTMSFMKAYKAMRGPRDVEPSPLFGCLAKTRVPNGDSAGEEEDDPFKLVGRDEVKLLNDVNDAIINDYGEDAEQCNTGRPTLDDNDNDGDARRQAVFYFERPNISPLLCQDIELPENCSTCNDTSNGIAVADYPLDHIKTDQGWVKANEPFESDDEAPYVSDDDGDPAEVRISPAVFRALAAGCTVNDVDSLLLPFPDTSSSLRPLTPQDKILDVSVDTTHRNNVEPYCHRRQFDIYTGEELSPAYRVAPGPASSILWSPPGVSPERAGLFLLLLQQGQGEQKQPARGSGMSELFQRMAPLECQELRTRLYGGVQVEKDNASTTLSPSSTSSSSSTLSSSPVPESAPSDLDGSRKEMRRTMTYIWSEVNEAVQHCRFDPTTASLTVVDSNSNSQRATAAASTGSGSDTDNTTTAVATERALLQTFRDSWQTIQAGQAAGAQLVAANECAQAAITAQARCLSRVEHQLAACRAAESARECREAQAHYRVQCQTERRAERRAHKQRHRRRCVVRAINEHLRSLRTTVGETTARLAQGRELQAVLAQRLRDGEARLARLCRKHDVADVAALSQTLADKLTRLGVGEEE